MTLYETGVRDAFDKYILEKAKEKRDYGPYWSASSAGYCMRKNIFDRLSVPPVKEDARLQRVFEVGHIFHEFMQRITKEAGLSVAQEQELINDKIMVKGHSDDLILASVDESGASARMGDEIRSQHLILYDYKTVNSMSFRYKKNKMGHYHTMQLGTYMYMLRKNSLIWNDKTWNKNAHDMKFDAGMLKDLKEARILNISKDDLRMSEQQLMWSPALEKMVYEYWSTLNGYWNKKLIPKCTCSDYDINEKTGIGFMADERYNPYYYEGEPCSISWLKKCKEEGTVRWQTER